MPNKDICEPFILSEEHLTCQTNTCSNKCDTKQKIKRVEDRRKAAEVQPLDFSCFWGEEQNTKAFHSFHLLVLRGSHLFSLCSHSPLIMVDMFLQSEDEFEFYPSEMEMSALCRLEIIIWTLGPGLASSVLFCSYGDAHMAALMLRLWLFLIPTYPSVFLMFGNWQMWTSWMTANGMEALQEVHQVSFSNKGSQAEEFIQSARC